MDAIADDEPPSIAELASFQADERAWVAVDSADRPIAYLLVSLLDGDAYIDQVSVHPGHARSGLGRALIARAAQWAQCREMGGLTLTCFVHVPWNAPYYERLGFRVLNAEHLTNGMRSIRRDEAAHGLDRWPRVAMRRAVTADPPQ